MDIKIQKVSLSILVSSVLLTPAVNVKAQQLEEIIVTAQRREQSLQEVPISIEAYSGDLLLREGYRDLGDLAAMTPGVFYNAQQNDTFVAIRGFGTTGNALTLEQATPFFVDGIHLGRAAQAKIAFLDVEMLEILKGPQPVYFGQNATAGAFNIRSRKPTPTWEGYVDAEYGTNDTLKLAGAVGGPINNAWGVRVAGKRGTTDGWMKDLVDGRKFPHYDDTAGRVTLQWSPGDNLVATLTTEKGKIRAGSQAKFTCLTGDNLIYGPSGPQQVGPTVVGDGRSIWAPPPIGTGTTLPAQSMPSTVDGSCFNSNITRSNEGPYYDVPYNVRQRQLTFGMLDIRQAADAWLRTDMSDPYTGEGVNAFKSGIGGHEDLDFFATHLNVEYQLSNGIDINWITGVSTFDRETSEENFDSGFYENNQVRHEDYDQWSSELRFTSPSGGRVEWMASAFLQDTTYDVTSGNIRATVRRGVRMNRIWEDVTWLAGVGNLTFNFFDNKASLDLGGRVAEITKNTDARGYGAQWVYNVEPVSGGACHQGNPVAPCYIQITDPSQHRIFLPYDPAAGLWYYPFDRRRTGVPDEWRGTAAAVAVGLTAPNFAVREGPYTGDFGSTEFDPQVTLRFRPTDNLSLFGRWAQSFKAGGFDTGQTTLPDTFEDYAFGPENAETFEVGAKGTLWDGRARFDATLFQLTFVDLQLQSVTPDPFDPNINLNVGKQRTRGFEFSFAVAVSEALRVSLAGAIMEGEMVDYPNAGCTAAEAATPDSGCVNNRINRSGQQSAYAPDWNFVLDIDYRLPVFNNYEMNFTGKGFLSSSYHTQSASFDRTVSYDTHGDISLNVGIGDQADTWRLSVYGRNLLEATPKYFRELDVRPTGLFTFPARQTDFATYGVKFQYNYR